MIHKAKKSLGQNFLKSETVLEKIVTAGEIVPEDIILEIGPGKGVLTEKLLKKASAVIAVEKDRELYEFLKDKFEKDIKSGALVLRNEDILDFDLSSTLSRLNLDTLDTYKIIANIPYNITGAILKKFLTATHQPERMVLMVQNEVAKRIVARDGKAKPHEIKSSGVARSAKSGFSESILSISVKAYGVPKIITKVGARYFSPKPKVDSAMISITDISRKTFTENKVSEEKFWKIVRAGFAHKRKKLKGNLKNLYQGEFSINPLSRLNLDNGLGNKRAEDLTLEDWISLTKHLGPLPTGRQVAPSA
ncbi:MAG: rRNA adenine dimethyltransferase family protein [bacterium]|nr:rRNA adenine dimethyltransferase family protein [bacterium]